VQAPTLMLLPLITLDVLAQPAWPVLFLFASLAGDKNRAAMLGEIPPFVLFQRAEGLLP